MFGFDLSPKGNLPTITNSNKQSFSLPNVDNILQERDWLLSEKNTMMVRIDSLESDIDVMKRKVKQLEFGIDQYKTMIDSFRQTQTLLSKLKVENNQLSTGKYSLENDVKIKEALFLSKRDEARTLKRSNTKLKNRLTILLKKYDVLNSYKTR